MQPDLGGRHDQYASTGSQHALDPGTGQHGYAQESKGCAHQLPSAIKEEQMG